ncbi:hypothetical protein GIB67_025031 [Kingdonia uniflora]|uniref:Secreted protein n=1 Tax=Kingdonia uniflora TaxID=39325 RepID=A0A7J7N7R0_9MAGN|nr:hypothetical protein GIB67_025031 [Kingdonia uniflora]
MVLIVPLSQFVAFSMSVFLLKKLVQNSVRVSTSTLISLSAATSGSGSVAGCGSDCIFNRGLIPLLISTVGSLAEPYWTAGVSLLTESLIGVSNFTSLSTERRTNGVSASPIFTVVLQSLE